MEGYKLKAECLFLICLGLLFCSELQFLVCLKIFNFESTKVERCLDGLCQKNRNERREKENENDKLRFTSNSLKLVEEVTPQILFLDTKPFVISTDELFQVDAYF